MKMRERGCLGGWGAVGLLGLLSCASLWGCADEPPAALEQPAEQDGEWIEGYWEEASVGDTYYSKTLTTVGDVISNRACSTAPTMGLNQQLAEEVNCIRPNMFSSISDISNLNLEAGANPFMQTSAASALRRAARANPGTRMTVFSSWRSVVQQHVLKSWEGSCGIRVAARPGGSNHESGLALDVSRELKSALKREGFSWYCDRTNGGRESGCQDPPHFDFNNGADLRALSVQAFQRLWNRANPNDRISEDGSYGPQTAARINRAPLNGFATGTTCGGDLDIDQPDPPTPQPPQPGEPGDQATLAALTRDAQGQPTGTPASIWRPSSDPIQCGTWSVREDFSSGAYNVHRYRVPLQALGELTFSLTRTAGAWSPAMYLVDPQGQVIVAGDASGGHPTFDADVTRDGRTGDVAQATGANPSTGYVYLYVTSWGSADAGLRQAIPQAARYTLEIKQTCGGGSSEGAVGEGGDLASLYRGLDLDGLKVPRAGLSNATLRSVHGVSTETYGAQAQWQGMTFVRGAVSWFGGPNDTGVSSTETGAITGERLRSLNNPLNPSDSALAANAEDYYYVAMRWDYSLRGKSAWVGARLLIVNPDTGAAVVVRPVDWGPNIRTERILDLSPQALEDLGLSTDEDALVAFVPASTPLGVVE